ncbi:hypothetical protein [Spiroplasma endosymbiont of Tiphia femorata]|uniref:hypothetical protein n=1 Tax=Spiroplasma endosymbiont of Tiphia femorata TaxID=3066326 RepID=UPI0030D3BE04
MTIKEFNEKYKNINLRYDKTLNSLSLSTEDDIKKIITKYDELKFYHHEQIDFIVQVTSDLLELQSVWEIKPTREYLKIEELEAQGDK